MYLATRVCRIFGAKPVSLPALIQSLAMVEVDGAWWLCSERSDTTWSASRATCHAIGFLILPYPWHSSSLGRPLTDSTSPLQPCKYGPLGASLCMGSGYLTPELWVPLLATRIHSLSSQRVFLRAKPINMQGQGDPTR